jgi:1,5-anhydro-D-fructose reductase (1,5-anhydro-D-mannitol-forming)
MLNVGIIGYGKMGRIRAQALKTVTEVKLTKVYDTQPIPDPPCQVAETDLEIIDDPDIQAVFICTPNFRIVPLCKAAMLAGKHVFSEKPPAFNAAELETVIAVEKQTGMKLMYGFNHRHHGSIMRMKEIIDSGDLGKVLWMRGRYGKEVDESYFEGWRADPKLAGGGIMLDQGIHMLDLFLHLGGDFDEIHAFVSSLFWKMDGLEDNVFAILRSSKNGICASLHSTMTQWRYLFSLEVFMEKGALVLNGLKTSSGVYGDEDLAIKYNDVDPEQGRFEREEHIIYHNDTSWISEVGQFIQAVLQGTPIKLGNSDDALQLMQGIDKIYRNT